MVIRKTGGRTEIESTFVFLQAAGHRGPSDSNTDANSYESILPGLMSAPGVLLNCRSQRVIALQIITSLQMKRSGAGSKAFQRLYSRFLATSYKTCLRYQQKLGEGFDKAVLEGKEQQRKTLQTETQSGTNTTPSEKLPSHPGYKLVGDNVDIMIRPRTITISHASTDLYYFHLMAVKNRVGGSHLSEQQPKNVPTSVDWAVLLPSADDHETLLSEWTVLVGKVIAKFVPALKWIGSYLPDSIKHEYSYLATKKIELVSTFSFPTKDIRLRRCGGCVYVCKECFACKYDISK